VGAHLITPGSRWNQLGITADQAVISRYQSPWIGRYQGYISGGYIRLVISVTRCEAIDYRVGQSRETREKVLSKSRCAVADFAAAEQGDFGSQFLLPPARAVATLKAWLVVPLSRCLPCVK
jgi:hypothetical protein